MYPIPLDSFISLIFLFCSSLGLPVGPFTSMATNVPLIQAIMSGIPTLLYGPAHTLKYQV